MNETEVRRTSIALSRRTADRINGSRIVPGELQESVINRALDCLDKHRRENGAMSAPTPEASQTTP